MTVSNENGSLGRRALLLYAAGFYLLVVVFLSPHAGSVEGKGFLAVARESSWDCWWDWAAAWCSVKVILLSLGVSALIAAGGMVMRLLKWEFLGKSILLLSAASALGIGLGAYLLVEALL